MVNKKRIPVIVVIFFMLCALPGLAQEEETEARWNRWNIGTRHGGGVAFVFEPNDAFTTDTNPSLNFITGYTGGFSIQQYSQPNFGLQADIMFVEKGWIENIRDTITPFDPVGEFTQNLSYIDVPIMAHGYVGKRNFRIYLEAGVLLSYIFDHNSQLDPGIGQERVTYRFVEGRDRRFNIGVAGGAGFEVVTAIGMFQLGGRYSLGFTSVIDKNITQIPNPLLMNAVGVTLGYYVQF
ncbi:MAG: porin family protein [Cyclobacteriaceae bacterium]